MSSCQWDRGVPMFPNTNKVNIQASDLDNLLNLKKFNILSVLFKKCKILKNQSEAFKQEMLNYQLKLKTFELEREGYRNLIKQLKNKLMTSLKFMSNMNENDSMRDISSLQEPSQLSTLYQENLKLNNEINSVSKENQSLRQMMKLHYHIN